MKQYVIMPWDSAENEAETGVNLEQYVPPELEKLAYEVCRFYEMSVDSMTLITSKPDKGGAIWRIDTNRGPRSLKVLHRTPQRSMFSVGAQEYVVGKGARVPALIRTKDGRNSVEAGGKLWIVTDWIETLQPVAKIDLEGARTLCYGLGEFHQWTKGYVPPREAGKSSRLFKWDSQYQKIMTKLGWFRHIAGAYRETAASAHLLEVLDKIETQAKQIYERFQKSAYSKMILKGEPHWGLAHQDFGWSNGQMGPGGLWVIDLDGVAYDLPIRDLRKIITSTMDDMGQWDLAWIRGVIAAYHAANPLDRETFELLWIDMAFPNEFYKHVKEVVYEPISFMNTELDAILDRIVMTETNKWEVLAELEKDAAKYPAGHYPEEQAVEQPFRYRDYAEQARDVAQSPLQPVPAPEPAPEQERRRPSRPARKGAPRRRKQQPLPLFMPFLMPPPSRSKRPASGKAPAAARPAEPRRTRESERSQPGKAKVPASRPGTGGGSRPLTRKQAEARRRKRELEAIRQREAMFRQLFRYPLAGPDAPQGKQRKKRKKPARRAL